MPPRPTHDHPLKVIWTDRALAQFDELIRRAPAQARAVFREVARLRRIEAVADVGHSVPGRPRERYRPVSPQGIFFTKDLAQWTLVITSIEDARRRRDPW